MSLWTRIRDGFARLTGRASTFTAAQSPGYRLPPNNATFSPSAAVYDGHPTLLAWARHLDQNDDVAIGVLDEMVNGVVGAGIKIDPLPGSVDDPDPVVRDQLLRVRDQLDQVIDVTGELGMADWQRLAFRALLRDGETFARHIIGRSRGYGFAIDAVPYRLEMIETEEIPADFHDADRRIRQGVELSEWMRPVRYFRYRSHPGELLADFGGRAVSFDDLIPIDAGAMAHCKFARRWPQIRGVTALHGIIERLADLGKLDEYERIAAVTAASMCAAITKDEAPRNDFSNPHDKVQKRNMYLEAGRIFDDLLPGESVEMLNPSRPNTNLIEYRHEMIRALCAGVGARYSPVARDFSGTWSSQRQELIEAEPLYAHLRGHFVRRAVREVWHRAVAVAVLDGQVRLPASMTPAQAAIAEYVAPHREWADPQKGVAADRDSVAAGFFTRRQIIQKRNPNPERVPVTDEPMAASSSSGPVLVEVAE